MRIGVTVADKKKLQVFRKGWRRYNGKHRLHSAAMVGDEVGEALVEQMNKERVELPVHSQIGFDRLRSSAKRRGKQE